MGTDKDEKLVFQFTIENSRTTKSRMESVYEEIGSDKESIQSKYMEEQFEVTSLT